VIHDAERYYCHLVGYSETCEWSRRQDYGPQIADEKQDITVFLLWVEY